MGNNSSSGAIQPFSFRGAKEERRGCLSLVGAINRHVCQTLTITVNFHLRYYKELWKIPGATYNASILLTTTAGHSTALRLHQHPLCHGLDITGHSIRKALSSIYFAVGIAKAEDHKLMTDIIKKISIQSKCFHFSVCLFLFYVYDWFAFM